MNQMGIDVDNTQLLGRLRNGGIYRREGNLIDLGSRG
jgi:hypothetical protein